MNRPAVMIPARLNSTRLPGKLIKSICGINMITRVCQEAMSLKYPTYLIYDNDTILTTLTTDRHLIFKSGLISIEVNEECSSGSQRCAKAIVANPNLFADIKTVILWQGDELLSYLVVKEFIEACRENQGEIVNLLFHPTEEGALSPDQVKARLFGDSLFPLTEIEFFHRLSTADPTQIGIYHYPKKTLIDLFLSDEPTVLERATNVELNRAIEEYHTVDGYLYPSTDSSERPPRLKLDTKEDLDILRDTISKYPQFPNTN